MLERAQLSIAQTVDGMRRLMVHESLRSGARQLCLETFDLPKGALRGAPPLPDDAVSTLRVPAYLVASQKASEDTVAALAKSIMEVRRELLADTPILAQVAAPDDESDAEATNLPGLGLLNQVF